MRPAREFTTRFFNPLVRRFAGRLPGFAVMTHVGRSSGRVYRSPFKVFRQGRDYVVALTYGSDVNWVRNVMAAGGGELREAGRTIRLTNPRLAVDPSASLAPAYVRPFLRLLRVTEFLTLTPV